MGAFNPLLLNPLLQVLTLLPGSGGCFVAFGADTFHKWIFPP